MHPLAFAPRDRLLARIEELERLLHETIASEDIPCVRPGECLTESQRRLVGALLARRGWILSRSALLVAMCFDRREADWPEPKTVDVQICKLRRKLDGITIRTVQGCGYVIDP